MFYSLTHICPRVFAPESGKEVESIFFSRLHLHDLAFHSVEPVFVVAMGVVIL
jgi:hypothetical protein